MIFLDIASASGVENVLRLIGLLLLCAVIIAASYFTTRFVGRKEAGVSSNTNFKPLDVLRISPNKYLQLIKVGKRYIVIAVCKDTVTYLTELDEEDIVFRKDEASKVSFKDILSKAGVMGSKKVTNTEAGSNLTGDSKKDE